MIDNTFTYDPTNYPSFKIDVSTRDTTNYRYQYKHQVRYSSYSYIYLNWYYVYIRHTWSDCPNYDAFYY